MAREPFNPNLIPEPEVAAPSPDRQPITVSQVTNMVRRAIESGLPATLHVVGEISNLKRHDSGHVYFTLKDAASELSCVMWRSAAATLKFDPTNGLSVIATGRVEVFERAGRYQLYARKLEPRGVGALELAFRQLCEKLEAEGLFQAQRKRPLPAYPKRIVLVTSSSGAAVADMIRTIERRYPCVSILLYPVRVQGDGAASEIADAVRRVNENQDRLGGVDLMIVGRGGGSLEDLWAFNEERVARAIVASRIPIVSAVGHETDVSIADLVADVRAATPTAAGEIAVPVLDDVLTQLAGVAARFDRTIAAQVQLATARLIGVCQRATLREPMAGIARRGQVIDELASRLAGRMLRRLQALRGTLGRLEPTLQRIAPHAHLTRQTLRCRDAEYRLRWALRSSVGRATARVDRVSRKLDRSSPAHKIPALAERLARVDRSVSTAAQHRLHMAREGVYGRDRRLRAVGYESVLGRGFSVTRTKKGRCVVRSIEQLSDRDRVVTQVADGEFESQVVNLNQLELFE
jgi:exodeoxyribonuclease VII large subunit